MLFLIFRLCRLSDAKACLGMSDRCCGKFMTSMIEDPHPICIFCYGKAREKASPVFPGMMLSESAKSFPEAGRERVLH